MFGLFGSKKYQNISVERASELLSDKSTVFLDIRTPQEKADGDIKGSKLINLWDANFAQKVSQLDKEKTQVYIPNDYLAKRPCLRGSGLRAP